METVDDAPLNHVNGVDGWTIEIIFKISPDWSVNYNRYTGIFSHQGMVDSKEEPAFSMALAEFTKQGNEDGTLGTTGAVDLQYIFVNEAETKLNKEFGLKICADQWVHYMITSDGYYTDVFYNGEKIAEADADNSMYILNSDFGWEVGVGRKNIKDDLTSNNEKHPEGLIRRLFCGSVSEIRFSEGMMGIENSLLYESKKETETETEPVTEVPTQAETTMDTATETQSIAESTVETTQAVTDNTLETATDVDTQGCQSSVMIIILPALLLCLPWCLRKRQLD